MPSAAGGGGTWSQLRLRRRQEGDIPRAVGSWRRRTRCPSARDAAGDGAMIAGPPTSRPVAAAPCRVRLPVAHLITGRCLGPPAARTERVRWPAAASPQPGGSGGGGRQAVTAPPRGPAPAPAPAPAGSRRSSRQLDRQHDPLFIRTLDRALTFKLTCLLCGGGGGGGGGGGRVIFSQKRPACPSVTDGGRLPSQ